MNLPPSQLKRQVLLVCSLSLLAALAFSPARARPQQPPPQADDAARLAAAMLGETPLVEDLRSLADEIGGRVTGTQANLRAVEWALARFREAGVEARKEAFTVPALWLEEEARAAVSGGGAHFSPRVVAMPFSAATPAAGQTAPLLDAGFGGEKDFERLGEKVRGAFVLVETHELKDIDGLFKEYADGAGAERRAFAAGAAGVVYASSRPDGVLYRHGASLGHANRHPLLVMEREEALRALRLLRAGRRLELNALIRLKTGGTYESYNVVGEIRGSESPEEFVVIGAHLDSWDLGTGALDNGCNVALVIDLARQMRRLRLRPTVRFALFNGEEQGMYGSLGYTVRHAAELDRHVMASSYDIGSGRISGFFTNGRAELLPVVERALRAVGGLGPFVNVNAPIVGTDNYDFMLQGVANLVANQESANYGPNYHARSDTFDKVDLRQLRLNASIAAAVTYHFAEAEVTWKRQGRAEIEKLMEATGLAEQMKSFGMWQAWLDGTRGRRR
jgi:carboxypeptidase Q